MRDSSSHTAHVPSCPVAQRRLEEEILQAAHGRRAEPKVLHNGKRTISGIQIAAFTLSEAALLAALRAI
jgi:hypothetical protein